MAHKNQCAKILLAGGAGMVGQNLTPMLQAAGARVLALDKNAANLSLLARLNPGVETHAVDLSEEGPWMDLFEGVAGVVDLKAQIASVQAQRYERNNVRTQQCILGACRRFGVPHLIHLSSSVVLSVAEDEYSESKRAAERLVRAADVPSTVLRPPLLFGCFDIKHLGFISRVLEKTPLLPIPGSGRYLRQPLYVLDLCRVILKCLERGPSNDVHNLIGHERLDFIDLIRQIRRARELRCALLPMPLPLFSFLLRLYAWLARKPTVIQAQLDALIAGDEFPVEDWTEQFGVAYTPFAEALAEMLASPRFPQTWQMQSPH